MIFAFREDGVVEVHGDLQSVQRDHEGVDVEDGVVHFYDDNGVYLEPIWIHPNRRGKLFGLLPWTDSGVFKLVANPQAECDSFALALYESNSLEPNPWFSSLEELKAQLASNGVDTRFRPPQNS